MHIAEPPTPPQDRPQTPQFDESFCVFVSHPLEATRSQSAKPALQDDRPHVPPMQLAEPLAKEHERPHPPQFDGLLKVFVSQPLLEMLSQFAKPALHAVRLHVPPTHMAEPLAIEQPRPHIPQCVALVSVFVSHPLLEMPSQFAKPGSHDPILHAPATQAARPLTTEQDRPHIPQFAVLVRMSTHAATPLISQSILGDGQSALHAPPTHI